MERGRRTAPLRDVRGRHDGRLIVDPGGSVFSDYRIALPKQEHSEELAPPRRIIQKGRHPMGSQAYVLTLRGAMKMLYHINHVPL